VFADFVNAIVSVIGYLWPFKLVGPWERGLYLVFGRIVTPWRWVGFSLRPLNDHELPSGMYLCLPFFTEVHQVAISYDYVKSGRLDLTLKDGRILTCAAVAKARIVDLKQAYIAYHDYEVDRVSAFQAAISETLVEADPDRFEAGKRGRLLGSSLLKAVREAFEGIGHEVESVQVTTFVLQPKVFRLLQEDK
jgi:regulator of protease activity HflC (stomatin/prohibitin superfamily)